MKSNRFQITSHNIKDEGVIGTLKIIQSKKYIDKIVIHKIAIHPPFLLESCCAGKTTLAESSGGSRSSSQAAASVVRILLLERASPGSAPLYPKPASSSMPATAVATSLPLSPCQRRCAQQRLAACALKAASSSVASLSFLSRGTAPRAH